MTVTKPHKHHYVPKMLVRRFAVHDERTFFLKKNGYHKPKLYHPSQLFYELDSNTYVSVRGEARREVEDQLSLIETKASSLIKSFVAHAAKDEVPVLSNGDRQILAEFVITLFKRSPEIRANHATEDFVRDTIKGPVSALLAGGIKISDELSALLGSSDWSAKALKQATVQATLRHTNGFISRISDKGILVAKPRSGRKSFILGNVPFLRLRGARSNGLGDPTSEFWLPISPQVAIVLYGDRTNEGFMRLHDDQVRLINHRIWNQCQSAVATNAELLISLSNSR